MKYVLVSVFLVVLVRPLEGNVLDAIGGFWPRGIDDIDFIGLVRWNVSIIGPILGDLLLYEQYRGKQLPYVLLREKSKRKYVHMSLINVFTMGAEYTICIMITFSVLTKNMYKINFFVYLLFYLHVVLVTMLELCILSMNTIKKYWLLVYGIVEIVMPIIGASFGKYAIYVITFWGMPQYIYHVSKYNSQVLYLFIFVSVGIIGLLTERFCRLLIE